MDWSLVANGVSVMAGSGLVLGILLGVAYRQFRVEIDPRVQSILGLLPGANCGACGLPGCEAAAEAIAGGAKPVGACVAGGHDVAKHIAQIMGVDAGEAQTPLKAVVKCGGGRGKVASRYDYVGAQDCWMANQLVGGPLACTFGCLGYGNCARSCPFDAMTMNEQTGLPVVDAEKCTGCGVCREHCARQTNNLIEMVPETTYIEVLCSSQDKPKNKKAVCPVACIGCKACEKVCPTEPKAITVQGTLAVVDHSLCTGCYACVEKCPTKCIVKAPASSLTTAHVEVAQVPEAQVAAQAADGS